MNKILNPLSWDIPDALVILGAGGLLTGLGGKYFFVLPLLRPIGAWAPGTGLGPTYGTVAWDLSGATLTSSGA